MPAQLISEFDVWRPGYDGATVTVYVAGTTTLANIFSDEALSNALQNPQTLGSISDSDGISYGKFQRSIYTSQAYFLHIDIGEDTGIKRPGINNLQGVDVSSSLVTVSGSSHANTLALIVGRIVHAQNYGDLEAGGSVGSAATNTTTIQTAIGALGASGVVVLPSGLFRINDLAIPAGVVLDGQGKDATTLQIISSDIGITLTGDSAGFRNMTLDGNILTTGSTGIYSVNRAFILFENFTIQNFDKGITCKGANSPQWKNFSVINCNTGAELHGDTDVGTTNLGGQFVGGLWDGGRVAQCSTIGVDLKYVDAVVAHFEIDNIFFDSNTGTAVRIKGAQFEPFNNCRWDGTALGINLDISDDTTVLAAAIQYQNKAQSILLRGGLMNGGTVKVTGNADDVVFEHMKLLGVTFNLVAPINNNVILKDCFEDSGTQVQGNTTQLVRQFGREDFEVSGLTTGNAPVRAWGITLEPNQYAYFEVKAIGVQRNGINKAAYHAVIGGSRAPSTLDYNNQTANFTVGDVLTGTNSGATARIIADSDSGTTGTLSLESIEGIFANGEIITGNTTGSANVNGAIVAGTHAVDSVGLIHLRTPYETDSAWDISFAFSDGEIAFQVQGNSSQTVDWTVNINLVTS